MSPQRDETAHETAYNVTILRSNHFEERYSILPGIIRRAVIWIARQLAEEVTTGKLYMTEAEAQTHRDKGQLVEMVKFEED